MPGLVSLNLQVVPSDMSPTNTCSSAVLPVTPPKGGVPAAMRGLAAQIPKAPRWGGNLAARGRDLRADTTKNFLALFLWRRMAFMRTVEGRSCGGSGTGVVQVPPPQQ